MSSFENESEPANKLCERCSKVDFSSFFSSEIKIYWLGSLSTIVVNDTCPFCCLIIHAINKSWMGQFSEIWSTANLNRINILVKTTFWAHCGSTNYSRDNSSYSGYDLERNGYLRFRPALGTDWMPEDNRHSWNYTARSTICELDYIPTEQYLPFCNEPRLDASQVLQRRPISNIVDISLIQSWIEECQSNHDHSARRANSQAQLQETGQFLVYDVIESRLIKPTKDVEYIALSYVWGGALRERQLAEPDTWWSGLFDDDEQGHGTKQGQHVRFEKLPRTVQDASWLLRRIGHRYLWVDLLCVCQNDSSKKALLINKMHLVYEGAAFTIVAAGGDDADSRLHGLHEHTRPSERTWAVPTNKGDLNLTVARPELKTLLSSTHWMTRGWTFQEDILSSCCLYFTRKEVFYSCDHHSPQSPLPGVGHFKGFHNGRFNEWREGYVLETRFTKTAYQSRSPWNNGWSRLPTRGLRCNNRVIQQSNGEILNEDDPAVYNFWTRMHSRPRSAKSDEFYEYAFFVHEYTQRNLTEPSDVISAFMGILSKFGTRLQLGANVQFHELLDYDKLSNDDIHNNSLEKALLWIPSCATALRRRCIKPGPDRMAPRQFPSWAWSGWVGPVDYLVEDPLDPLSGASNLSNQPSWVFSPATFEPKAEPIHMRRLFKWSSHGDRRVVAWLQGFEDERGNTPKESLNTQTSCILTIFTHVAKVKRLTRFSGFMAQNYQTWGDRHYCHIHSPHSKRSYATISPDSGTENIEGKYKLVCIGKGRKEWVVLLLKQKGNCYERAGLTTVLPDTFEWTLKWVDIA